jgi:hypothetical protein
MVACGVTDLEGESLITPGTIFFPQPYLIRGIVGD